MRKLVAMAAIAWAVSVSVVEGQQPRPGWVPGPTVGNLGQRATINVPEGYFFLGRDATRRYLEENQNVPDGDELGTIVRVIPGTEQEWFAVFSYSDIGHVKDDEKDSIDAAQLLSTMKEGSQQQNEARKKRGWAAVDVEGWHQPPFYDAGTHNLTWALRLTSEGAPIINHSVRLLGRTGMMSAQLVADPAVVDLSISEFDQVLTGYTFNEGSRYAEFRSGDKLAEYGLTALIAGGAGAAAVKTGALQKLWKFLVFAVVAVVGAVKKFFSGLGTPERTERPIPVVPTGPRA